MGETRTPNDSGTVAQQGHPRRVWVSHDGYIRGVLFFVKEIALGSRIWGGIKRVGITASVVSLLTGCASAPLRPPIDPPYAAVLSSAARQVSAAWGVTARESHVFQPVPHLPALMNAPPGLQETVRADWVGPPTPLVRALAHRAGWAFRELGTPPPNESVVTVRGRHPLLVFLEQVGSQITNGRVIVNARTRVVAIDWEGP